MSASICFRMLTTAVPAPKAALALKCAPLAVVSRNAALGSASAASRAWIWSAVSGIAANATPAAPRKRSAKTASANAEQSGSCALGHVSTFWMTKATAARAAWPAPEIRRAIQGNASAPRGRPFAARLACVWRERLDIAAAAKGSARGARFVPAGRVSPTACRRRHGAAPIASICERAPPTAVSVLRVAKLVFFAGLVGVNARQVPANATGVA